MKRNLSRFNRFILLYYKKLLTDLFVWIKIVIVTCDYLKKNLLNEKLLSFKKYQKKEKGY